MMKKDIESGNVKKEINMFTLGCCITCLSVWKFIKDKAQTLIMDYVTRRWVMASMNKEVK